MATFWRFSIRFYYFLPFPEENTFARRILVFLTKKINIFVDFCRNLRKTTFRRKYSHAVPIGAADATNREFRPSRSQNQSYKSRRKYIFLQRPLITPSTPPLPNCGPEKATFFMCARRALLSPLENLF